ncbi:hypothetical protein BTVI_00298 [Pitangus sulphuratus]|nr:hypothetical protein BTVI_00298 [Pitangus sulphuratus]
MDADVAPGSLPVTPVPSCPPVAPVPTRCPPWQAQGSCGELALAQRAAESEECRLRDALAKTSDLASGLAREKAELCRRLERLERERERGRLRTRELLRELAQLRARLERGRRAGILERQGLERARSAALEGSRGVRAELRALRQEHLRLRQHLAQVGMGGGDWERWGVREMWLVIPVR